MQRGNCNIGSTSRSRNGSGRVNIIPVGSTDNNSVSTNTSARETKIVGGEGTVRKANTAEVTGNGAVETDRVTRDTLEVVAEQSKTSMELIKDDGLGLDLADLFGDDSLGHLLKDEETLLDNLDDLSMADNLLGSVYNLREVHRAVEVVDTIEVVKVGKGG
jgi:hypothetical protein